MTTDGCNYILDSDTTTGGHVSGEHATWSLECEANHDITKDAACNVTIQGLRNSTSVNQSVHGVRCTQVTHSSKISLTATMTIGNIHYTTTGGGACTLIGRPDGSTYATGITEGNVGLTGYEDGISTGTTTSGTTWAPRPASQHPDEYIYVSRVLA